MALEPGGSPDYLEDGSEILYTQAPQNLEELLGKFIFSMQKSDKEDKDEPDVQAYAHEPVTPSSEEVVKPKMETAPVAEEPQSVTEPSAE